MTEGTSVDHSKRNGVQERGQAENEKEGQRRETDTEGGRSTQDFHQILLELSFLLGSILNNSRFWHKSAILQPLLLKVFDL